MAVNANPITDIFRFVAIRQPQLPETEIIASNFVTYDFFDEIDSGMLAAIETSEPLLYTTLTSRIGQPNARQLMEQDVDNYRNTSSRHIPDIESLYTIFQGLKAIDEWLHDNATSATFTQLKDKIEEILGTPVADYVSDPTYLENKLFAWDNLFSSMVIPDRDALREEFVIVIRILRIIERVNDADSVLSEPNGIRNAVRSTVVMPSPLFPLPKVVNVIPESDGEPDDSEQLEIEANLLKIQTLETAFLDIKDVIDIQYLQNRTNYTNGCSHFPDTNENPNFQALCDATTSDANKDPLLINNASYDRLSQLTKNVIKLYLPVNPGTTDPDIKLRYAPYLTERIQRDLTTLGSKTFKKFGNELIVALGGTLIAIKNLCIDRLKRTTCDPVTGVSIPKGSGQIKPIGIGDLLVVRQQLLKYELGEIAHIENILSTENKKRVHRSLNRTEETLITETETTNEQERDTQTTERFGLEKESQSIVQSDTSLQLGATLSASYGVVSLSASANYASNNSSLNSNSVASSYARSVTERAVSKVIERVRTQRSITTIREVEETNEHGFNNETGNHVIGQYHWVDKFYLAQVYNYGKRLMFEFMIPEPAAFHIYSKANRKSENSSIEKPIPPDADAEPIGKLLSFKDITLGNYAAWASRYDAQDVTAPPQQFKRIATASNLDQAVDNNFNTFKSLDLEVPDGYKAKTAYVRYGYSIGANSYIRIFVGRTLVHSGLAGGQDSDTLQRAMDGETGKIPLTIQCRDTYWVVNVEIECELSLESFDAWRLKTYNSIISAYERKKSLYQDELNALEVQAGVNILGLNPERNREIEREELKKGCIELLTDQKFDAFDAMRNLQPTANYPEFRNIEAKAEGDYIKFFENAFEWEQITYIFYPYFWGRKPNWVTIKQYEDNDPLFTKFLQAGAARVVIPVRPAFTEAVLYFTESGNIWNGDSVPTIDDPLHLSIVEEIKSQTDLADGVPLDGIAPWVVKVPTALVKLAATVDPPLPDFTSILLP